LERVQVVTDNPSVNDAFGALNRTVATPVDQQYAVTEQALPAETTADVRIEMTGHARGEVFINGKQVDCVTGIRLNCAVGQPNTVEIIVAVRTLIYSGPTDITND